MPTRAEWQDFSQAYKAARQELDGGQVGDAVEHYLDLSETLNRPPEQPGVRAFAVDGSTDWSYGLAASKSAGDVDIAISCLRAMPVEETFAIQAIQATRLLDLESAFPSDGRAELLASASTDGQAELIKAIDDYLDGVITDGASVVNDVAGFISKVGVDNILGAAGKLLNDFSPHVPFVVRRFVSAAVRAIVSAIARLRTFIHAHFPDVEKAVADWWKKTVGDAGFTGNVLGMVYDLDHLKKRGEADVRKLSAGADFGRGVDLLEQTRQAFNDGESWVSTIADLASKAWFVLSKFPQAALVGGVVGASLLAFVVVRGGDYVDMDQAGPISIPWVDFVDGPVKIVAGLAPS